MKRACFYSRIGLCNPCPSHIETTKDPELKSALKKKYASNIRRVISILSGKTDFFSKALEQDLKKLSSEQRYEEAIEVRNKLLQFSIFLDKRSFSEESLGVNVDLEQLGNEVHDFLLQQFQTVQKDTYRLECYDISNLFGEDATASMVVFKDGEFSKKDYRKFAIQHKGISDIHMMREALRRRLGHPEWELPDLILLDGGKPQLSMVFNYFRESNINIPLISIAKRPDRIITPHSSFKPISISNYVLLFKLFQSLRDESHRFAKKYHVFLRNRNQFS